MIKSEKMKLILAVALPVAFQSLIQSSLGFIDQIMVARLGGTYIAAAGLATHPITILFFLLLGVAGGTGIFTAQYYGNRQFGQVQAVVRLSLRYGMSIVIPLMFFAGLTPKLIMSVFTTDPLVIQAGGAYLGVVSLSFVPLMIILVSSSALKACGDVKLPFKAGITAVVVNTVLNYVLIYGLGSFAGLGLTGAAIATVTARIVEASILIVGYKKLSQEMDHQITRNGESATYTQLNLKNQFKNVTIPLILGELVFITSITFYTILYGRMGTVEMAAVTVMVPLQNITFGLFSGMSTAAAVIIGQSLGKSAYDEAQDMAQTILKFTAIGAVALCMIFVLITPLYLNLFGLNTEIYKMSEALSWMIILFLPVRVLNMVLGDGIIKCGGDTKFMLKMAIFTLTGIGIPLGLFTGYYLGLSLPMVYIAVSLEEIIRFAIGYWKMKSGTWKVNLTGIGQPVT